MAGKSLFRSVDELILPEVRHTIEKLELTPADSAAATLAERYASAIDAAACSECGGKREALDKLGPKLLAALAELGATPAARSKMVKGGGAGGGGKLAGLRAARAG